MMRKVDVSLTMTIIIMIRPFAVIISVHNGISAAIGIITGIILMLPWIMGAGAEQQRNTDDQHFFIDRIHFNGP